MFVKKCFCGDLKKTIYILLEKISTERDVEENLE